MTGKLILNTIAFADLWKMGRSQVDFVPMTAELGFDGIEIRSEMLQAPETECLKIAETAKVYGLETYYSVNAALVCGSRLHPHLDKYMQQAAMLRASHIKFNVGDVSAYQGNLKEEFYLAGKFTDCAVNVENNQSLADSRLENIEQFFSLVSESGADIGFCFDLANWYWTESDPLTAAERLASVTRYIHLKSKTEQTGKRQVTSLAAGEIDWRTLLQKFQPGLPMALEYAAAAEVLLQDVTLLKQ